MELNKFKRKELLYFCLQYNDWINQIKDIEYGITAAKIDGMPKNKNISKPTEELAIKKTELLQKCNIVEQSAKEANPEIYKELLKNVTQNIPYERLDVSYSRRQFYRIKNEFLCILFENKVKNSII